MLFVNCKASVIQEISNRPQIKALESSINFEAVKTAGIPCESFEDLKLIGDFCLLLNELDGCYDLIESVQIPTSQIKLIKHLFENK